MSGLNFLAIEEVFPRALTPEETRRGEALAKRSLELIAVEFHRRGRDLFALLESEPWMETLVRQAMVRMVSQAIMVGNDVGRASVSSTTGPQSDSITYSQGVPIHWGMVEITPDILRLLGLQAVAVPLGRGGPVIPYGQRGTTVCGAEFSERCAQWLRR